VAVVTNVEADHLDIYGDLAGVEEGFREFVRGVRAGGRVAVCADDHGASRLLAAIPEGGYSYGLSAGSQLRAVDVEASATGTRCRVVENGDEAVSLSVGVPGLHNLRNALGAAAAARHLGVAWDAIGHALAAFRGVGRRFERLGEAAGVVVNDDYAHHPTEIRATLHAARAAHPDRRLVAVFQPHLYSRTRDFQREFGSALAEADVVWVTDVFPAREQPIPGVTGELIASAAEAGRGAEVRYHPDVATVAAALVPTLRDRDVVVTLGAGSVETVGAQLLDALKSPGGRRA
jgi:UDP-N-acetylmuramate--alanine ligase